MRLHAPTARLVPRNVLRAGLVLTGVLACATSVSAQCVDWSPGYHLAGIDGVVNAMVVHDDGAGSGPQLYVGGTFQVAGDLRASNVARWNGARWAPVGAGRPATVGALCVFDDGSGPALYAGLRQSTGYVPPSGTIEIVARWNGVAWAGLPGGVDFGHGSVRTMTVHDSGDGTKLYVGGQFQDNAPVWPAARQIARFDGTAWSPVGDGFPYSSFGVYDLESFDDGGGPRLYAGGYHMRVVPGTETGPVAVFDGTQWQLAVHGIDTGFSQVTSLARFGPGNGSLYAAGERLLGIGSNALMQRVGSTWTVVGSVPGTVAALHAADIGQGPQLYLGGVLVSVGGIPAGGVAGWDGSAWHTAPPTSYTPVSCLAAYDEGAGNRLFAGANIPLPGADASGVARFDAAAWSALGTGVDPHPALRRMVTFDDGTGPALFAASDLGLRKRVGGAWVLADPSMTRPVGVIAVHDEGAGAALYASVGSYADSRIDLLRWDGATWTALGTGIDFLNPNWMPAVYDLVSFDGPSGPLLVAAGDFDVAGGEYRPFVAAWDGTSWIALGTGFDHIVRDLQVYDAGAGPVLYAGGQFNSSNTQVLPGLARFDGTGWVSAGAGAPRSFQMHVHDFGAGARLYAATNVAPFGIDVFDGASWSAFSSASAMSTFASYDDGTGGGPELVVAGGFTTFAGMPANGIASYDGVQWHAFGDGLRGGAVAHLHVFDDGAGAALFANGTFVSAGEHAAFRFARYGPTGAPGCVPTTGTVSCAGDGGGAACPCGNTGGADRGCGNSANSNGASLVAEGQAHRSADTVTLRASGMTPGGAALFFQGTQSVAGGAGTAFGDGVRCASGAQIRLAIRSVSGGVASFGAAIPGDASVSDTGQLPAGTSSRVYQVWYRDAQVFCTTSTFNLSNGMRIVWAP